MSAHGIIQRLRLATRELQAKQAAEAFAEAKRQHLEALRAHERRPLSPCFRGTCRQTRSGGGLPETEEGEEGGIPAGITHDLVLQIDLPARKAEREERLLSMHGGDVNKTLRDICEEGGGGKDARFLLAHGADANHRGKGERSMLSHAAERGHLAVVEALLDAGAEQLGSGVWRAAFGGHNAIIALLLDRGADINHFNGQALFLAADCGHLETATLLLQRGATVDNHMLARAVLHGHHAIADLLRSHLP